jgi:hypothetical protein
MGLMAGLAASAVHRSYANVEFEDLLERVAAYDARCRQACRLHGRAANIMFYADRMGQERVEADDATYMAPAWKLPAGYRFAQVLCLDGRSGFSGIRVSADGRSSSYLVQLFGPDRAERWLVVCGLTGETKELRDAWRAYKLLGKDRRKRPDAH